MFNQACIELYCAYYVFYLLFIFIHQNVSLASLNWLSMKFEHMLLKDIYKAENCTLAVVQIISSSEVTVTA